MITSLERIAAALERLAPQPRRSLDFRTCLAARWHASREGGWLEAVEHPHWLRAGDLVAINDALAKIDDNTRQFVAGLPANNVLLTGARGTGKSSLVKAMLERYHGRGLRLIEVDKRHLVDVAAISQAVAADPHRFIIFCDDLSFDAGDDGYRALKAALDGSIAGTYPNVLIYATSNRRHLLPEYFHENAATQYVGDEIHFGEGVEEKVSLSERFGLWIPFYAFSQDDYLCAVERWVKALGGPLPGPRGKRREHFRKEALQWALQRGSRSGRVAHQFARDWCGRTQAQAQKSAAKSTA